MVGYSRMKLQLYSSSECSWLKNDIEFFEEVSENIVKWIHTVQL
jgi:hypothetical protein